MVKMTLICRDIFHGNPKLYDMGWYEESLGRNGLLGGFQGQRMWSDWQPNGDFTEAMLNTTFDWNGIKQPTIFATENDTLNATSMLFGHLLTGCASIFADVRTYWSPDAVKRVTGWQPEGRAEMALSISSTPAQRRWMLPAIQRRRRHPVMKPWWR